MERREFFKLVAAGSIGLAVAPKLLGAVPRERDMIHQYPLTPDECYHPMRIWDTVIIPCKHTSMEVTWEVFIISTINQNGSITVMPTDMNNKYTPAPADVFIHCHFAIAPKQPEPVYAHVEEKLTHELYVITSDTESKFGEHTFKYSPLTNEQHEI